MLLFGLCSTSDVSQTGQWTQTPSTTPLQPIKWNVSFWIMFTSDDQPGWSMDSHPICHPSPANKMKYSFLDYVQLLMISWAGRWTQTPFTTPLQPKKWNAHFLIMFNFWWSAGLVNGLKPHLPPLSSQKNEMLIFVLHLTSDVCQTGQWTQTPSTTPLQPKKWNASFMDYTQLVMIGWAEWWTRTPSTTPLQPKKWNACFLIMFTSDDLPGWLMNLNLICHPSPTKNMKCSIFDYVQLLMVSQAGQLTQSPSASPLQPIKWNASFWIMFTSDDQLGWSMDLNPICQPSPAKKIKCYFLDYVQLLMISWAGQWTSTPSATPLRPETWNAHIWITFNFWWLAGLVNGLKPHPPPLSSQKSEMLIFVLHSTCDVGQTGQWTWT